MGKADNEEISENRYDHSGDKCYGMRESRVRDWKHEKDAGSFAQGGKGRKQCLRRPQRKTNINKLTWYYFSGFFVICSTR